MIGLKDMPNIGPHAVAELCKAGIATPAQLADLGAQKAWLKMKVVDSGVCLHQLYALEGAILGVPTTMISPERKEELRQFYRTH